MQIEVEVKGQRIKRINSPGSVEDTLNYLTCYFTFDGEEWDNTVKTAYFRNPASGKTYSQILAEDNTCTVPWEALTDWGFVKFSVSGERENYRITTDIESFYNGETVYGGEPSEPPTPDQYDQMIALAEQTKEIAESVRRDADEGKFDGDPGEPGKPGAPGRDGVSPTAKVEQTDDGAVITITDAAGGTTTAELKNGKEGNPGQNATDEQVRTAVDAYMKENPIQGDTEDIIKLAIKNEASGAVPVVIADSAEMGVQDIKMQGWTEQDSTTGVQLFDASKIQTKTQGGATATNNGDGSFTINGNGNLTEAFSVVYRYSREETLKMLKPGKITLNTESNTNPYVRIGIRTLFLTNNAHGEVKTAEITSDILENESTVLELQIYGSAGSAIVSGTFKPMVYQNGNGTYEPYTGGQPSPNPDYPQEITSAGKYDEGTGKYQYEVKLTGKNLWDTIKGSDSSNWVGSTSQSGYSDFAIDVSAGQKVTVSFPEKLPTGKGMYVGIVLTEDGNIYKWMYHSTQEGLIFQQQTVTAVGDKIWIRCNNGSIPWFSSDNPYFQIEYGEERTDFQPYKEQTVLLTSDRPLTKWDKLEKRDGVWGWVYKSGKKVIDGTETYFIGDAVYISEKSSNAYINNNDMVKGNPALKNGYCNRLTHVEAVWSNLDSIGFCYNKNQIHMRISNDSLGTTSESTPQEVLSAMKNYMSQQYNDGNPFVFWYETAEETFAPLSESEQSALNALTTYYPTTVLDNDQGCDMALTYIADTKAYIDNKVSAIQAAIVNAI